MYACLAWFQISPSGAGGGGGGAADATGTAATRLADLEGLGCGGSGGVAAEESAFAIGILKGAFAGSGGGSFLVSITHRVNVTDSHKSTGL